MTIQKLLLIGGASVVALAAIAIIVWWFAVREDAKLATSPPEIPCHPVTSNDYPGHLRAVPGNVAPRARTYNRRLLPDS